jgi:hypothetical protein
MKHKYIVFLKTIRSLMDWQKYTDKMFGSDQISEFAGNMVIIIVHYCCLYWYPIVYEAIKQFLPDYIPCQRTDTEVNILIYITNNNRERIDTVLRNNFVTFKFSYIYFQLILPRMSLEVFIILPNTLNVFSEV